MFNVSIIKNYNHIAKKDMILWIKTLINQMHIDLDINPDVFAYVDVLFRDYDSKKCSVSEIRIEAFKLHEIARKSKDQETILCYRIYGQALSSIHVKTHAFHAANYMTKLYKSRGFNEEEVYLNQIKQLEKAY